MVKRELEWDMERKETQGKEVVGLCNEFSVTDVDKGQISSFHFSTTSPNNSLSHMKND